jgi:prepilin-type N-terminal cleavage/methylation domain-containing protein
MIPAQKGFTLIELLIVISLVTIITGAVVPSFNSYIDSQYLKQTQETVIDDLRTIQNKALNGENAQVELGAAGDERVHFWGVKFTQDQGTYDYFISVDADACGDLAADDDIQEEGTSSILPAGNVIRSPTNCYFISFENGGISWATNDNDTITVGPAGGGPNSCSRITVTADGLVRVDGGQACAP